MLTIPVTVEEFPTIEVRTDMLIGQPEKYQGSYHITPSTSAQAVETAGKRLTSNIIIDPIPSNYALVSWNGSVLTVS